MNDQMQVSADDQRRRLAGLLEQLEAAKAEQKALGAAQAAAEAKVAAGKNLRARIEGIMRSGANATEELEELQRQYREAIDAQAELEQISARGQSIPYLFLLGEIRNAALAILIAEGQQRLKEVDLARQAYIGEWSQLFALVKCLSYDIKNFERMPVAEEAAERLRRSYTESPRIDEKLVIAAVPEWLSLFQRLCVDANATL
jgi:hypothetical protein